MVSLAILFCSCGNGVDDEKSNQSTSTDATSKTQYVEKIVTQVENTWGLDFVSTPIDQASAAEIEASKAVAYVNYREGGCATGFFISDDGLFLTNEHVLSRQRCHKGKCPNIKIIRDYKIGGAIEVYDDFEVLAHNYSLDYALAKVKLKDGEKVPFLKMEWSGATEAKNFEGSDLKIIGHPNCSSLRTGNAIFSYGQDQNLVLRSIAISGNSGSPLFDLTTKKVVGLYHASYMDYPLSVFILVIKTTYLKS